MRKCKRMLQSREDAEDIVQGLFLDMLKKGKTDLDLPYLYRAVTNRCINHLRYGTNRMRLLERHDVMLRGPVRTRCDEQVIGMDLLVKLSEALDRKTLEVLVLRYFDDMTHEEIASLLGVSRKTVGKRIGKVRAQVKKLSEGGDR